MWKLIKFPVRRNSSGSVLVNWIKQLSRTGRASSSSSIRFLVSLWISRRDTRLIQINDNETLRVGILFSELLNYRRSPYCLSIPFHLSKL